MFDFMKLRIPFLEPAPARDPTLPPPKLDRAGQLLWAAADLIEKRGLERIVYAGQNGELCIHGAMAVASGSKAGEQFKSHGALTRVHHLVGDDAHRWIRDPSVTKEMVVAKMREAALLS